MPLGPRWKQKADEWSGSLGTVKYSPLFPAHTRWGGGWRQWAFIVPTEDACPGWVALTLSRPSSELPLHNLFFPPLAPCWTWLLGSEGVWSGVRGEQGRACLSSESEWPCQSCFGNESPCIMFPFFLCVPVSTLVAGRGHGMS